MSEWSVGGDDNRPAMKIRTSQGDQVISLHMPSPDPVPFSVKEIEQLRQVLAAAIGEAQATR